jgi:hypothetical protein
VIAGIATFLGWKSLNINLTTYFKDEVEKWVRFEDSDSGSKKTLNEIRTKALLNANTIRLLRSYYSPYATYSVQLSKLEIERLVEIIVDPVTPYGDFIDALRLVSKSRGIFILRHPEDEIGKKITAILMSDNEGHDAYKKGQILEYMSKDESLLIYSKGILAKAKNDESIKISAFKNVSNFEPKFALEFAKKNINIFTTLSSRTTLAEYLVKNEPSSNVVKEFLNSLMTTKPKYWEMYYLSVLTTMLESDSALVENVIPILELIPNLINSGAMLALSESSSGPRYLSMTLNGTGSALETPNKFLSNSKFITSIVTAKKIDFEWLFKVVEFFQIKDYSYFISTLIMTPRGSTKLILMDSSTVTSKDVLDDIWLRSETIAGVNSLTLTWRDKTGMVKDGIIKNVFDAEKSKYKISYDPKVVDELSYRNVNNLLNFW